MAGEIDYEYEPSHDAAAGIVGRDVALTEDSAERKNIPMARGLLDYFPAALAAVAELSRAGNDKHNPGQELHHARGKSSDHADCILRHLTDRGTLDSEDGLRHSTKVAWRALALLQEELEAAGAPLARGARLPDDILNRQFYTGPCDGSCDGECGSDACRLLGKLEARVAKYTVKPVPRHQYDPESTDGGW